MTVIRDVLVVPHAHHDVGYTHSPRVILPLHAEAVREAIRLASEGDATDPAAFRWTFENSRPVAVFLRDASGDEVAALRAGVAAGRLSVTGGYLNSTQLTGQEELARSYEPVDLFRRLGLPVRIVQHSDINGLPWGTVPAMVRAGLNTIVMALNPDHGRPPFEQPTAFWWEGPDGTRVLAWLSLHYGLAETWGLLDGEIERFDAGLRATVARIERRSDYPFDFLVLHATDDNGWPTLHAADGVRAWNERFGDFGMTTATIDTAMQRALAQAAGQGIPTCRGEWADWWAHGHGSTAYEVGLSRTARSQLRTAEAALALARLGGSRGTDVERRTAWRRDPVRRRSEAETSTALSAAWDELLLFEEHTWGADESVRAPDSDFTRSHWNAKAARAFSAFDASRDLLGEALWRLDRPAPSAAPAGAAASSDGEVLVFNPLPYARTEPLVVERPEGPVDIVARDVPGLGVSRVAWTRPSRQRTGEARTLETPRYVVEVDPARGGVVRLRDRDLDWDLVDGDAGEPLGAVIVESIDPGVDHPLARDRARFRPDTPGPAFLRAVAAGGATPLVEHAADRDAISWTTSCAGLTAAHSRLTVYRGLARMRLVVTLVKPESREPEGVYVAFPFRVANPAFLLETAGAVFAADTDQLPDTCRDWYSVQHAAGITDGVHGVLWTTHQAPLVQLGSIGTGRWARRLDARAGHVYAWLMNNLYFTNFRAEQGGTASFAFEIEPRAGALDADEVRRAGERAALPLAGRLTSSGRRAPHLLDMSADALVAASLGPDHDDRSIRVRLEASSKGAACVRLRWRGARPIAAWRADVFGNRGAPLDGDGHAFSLSLAPRELATIVLSSVEAPSAGSSEGCDG